MFMSSPLMELSLDNNLHSWKYEHGVLLEVRIEIHEIPTGYGPRHIETVALVYH